MADSDESLTDQQLIAAINAGRTEAFDVLYDRYRDWVLKMAWRFTRNREDALDVLQETFLYLAGRFPGFQLTAAMTTFLYPAVRHLSLAAGRRRRRFDSGGRDVEHLAAETAGDADRTADNLETFAAVVAGLQPDHREILCLRFVDGLGPTEIGKRLGVPTGTAKSRLHHALRAVKNSPVARRLLCPDGPPPGFDETA